MKFWICAGKPATNSNSCRQDSIARQADADVDVASCERCQHRLTVPKQLRLTLEIGSHAQPVHKGGHIGSTHATLGGIAITDGFRLPKRAPEGIDRAKVRSRRLRADENADTDTCDL